MSVNYERRKSNGYAHLEVGSIVACDLVNGLLDHSGIYVGNGEIVELNGNSEICKISLYNFITSSDYRTGQDLFVATWKGKTICSQEIADRAIIAYEQYKNREIKPYNIVWNNCHQFCAECVNGSDVDVTLFSSLSRLLAEQEVEKDTPKGEHFRVDPDGNVRSSGDLAFAIDNRLSPICRFVNNVGILDDFVWKMIEIEYVPK